MGTVVGNVWLQPVDKWGNPTGERIPIPSIVSFDIEYEYDDTVRIFDPTIGVAVSSNASVHITLNQYAPPPPDPTTAVWSPAVPGNDDLAIVHTVFGSSWTSDDWSIIEENVLDEDEDDEDDEPEAVGLHVANIHTFQPPKVDWHECSYCGRPIRRDGAGLLTGHWQDSAGKSTCSGELVGFAVDSHYPVKRTQ